MTTTHQTIEEVLLARLCQINEELKSVQHLIEERQRIEDLLAYYNSKRAAYAAPTEDSTLVVTL